MIYGYIRTSRAAVDGLAGMHPETQVQALADAGVESANLVSDVAGSAPVVDRPGWTSLDARLLRGASPAPLRSSTAPGGPVWTPACSAAISASPIPSPSPPWTGSAATGLNWWPPWSPCTSAGSALPPWLPPSPGFTPLSRVNHICRLASIVLPVHLLDLDALLGSVAVRPSYMCKSEPQIQEEVIFTMPSLGCCSSGSGTFSAEILNGAR